jgi:hypothetical protein
MSRRNVLWTEFEIDGVSHWLIHHAARRAPESLSSRLEEEWLANPSSSREFCGGGQGAYHTCRSKLRLRLASLRYAFLDLGTSCRAFLRTDHDPLAYARVGGTAEFAESSTELCADGGNRFTWKVISVGARRPSCEPDGAVATSRAQLLAALDKCLSPQAKGTVRVNTIIRRR